ncbi:MAG: molybdopterin-dependent oxidoreductase [Candidatus Omnitrophica bacterium]|nr:molybdopterin-dependent oxidoreductase [Candidatus Omnitrophota bacterium]
MGAGSLSLFGSGLALGGLAPLATIENPLKHYPTRDWEKVYRDQYRYDSSFTYICAPNDTHNCRFRGFVRNGVMIRTEQNYDVDRCADLYGNKATQAWHPRGCSKGYTIQRRLYGPYRLNHPLIRAGWKAWADDGFPSLSENPELRDKYKFNSRGRDTFVRASWDEIYGYLAKAAVAIAKTYSGAEGEARLAKDGYEPEMVHACHGAGTRTMKLRGGMGLLGVMGKYGIYRWSNMLALLDQKVRGVPEAEALGGRLWSNYTWHGDQAPGHPYVHGLQASDCDFNELRHAKLHIQCGKNLVENKMPEAHWFITMMERGGKIVVITPEYSPASTKANYWIRVRPGCTDTALFLAVTKHMIDQGWYDEKFLLSMTDFPLLIRADTLTRLRASDIIPNYALALPKDGPSYKVQHITDEQYRKIGDFTVFDSKSGKVVPITRDQVSGKMEGDGISPQLAWTGKVTLADGTEVEAMTTWEGYRLHLKDYDLETASEITGAEKEMIERLARDIWETASRGHSVAVHVGEGINHWFHATLCNRAQYLPLMLTGSIGRPGAGCYTWAGNYKAALFQGAADVGPGFLGWIAENPFAPNLDPAVDGKDIKVLKTTKDEEPAYWNHGDRPLVVETPKYGRKCFTGDTHMPTPTKFLWFTNVNLFNNAKHAYDMLFNVNPKIDCIISQDVEMNSTVEYSDLVLPALMWPEFQTYEVTASCSNPFLQIWTGGLAPTRDGRDDIRILAETAEALGKEVGDSRFADYWKFVLEDKKNGVKVYLQRLLDGSTTTRGYKVDDILNGQYGEEGAALMLFRTYPRIPFWENIKDGIPFWTDTGRLNSYCDIPEAILHGENFIVHREGPEATPYLPNVIVSSNPLIRPDDFGIPPDALGWDERTIRNIKLPWKEVKGTVNPLWQQGFRFYCLTPKTRHRVHSSWSVVEWHQAYDSNFADFRRKDKRQPGVGEHQLHVNPADADALGLKTGDYVYVDANPADRPFRGWEKHPELAKVGRAMLRVTVNPAYPAGIVMMKHGAFIATEKTVLSHESRPDKLACSEDTGYQANFRYGSHQSITRNWLMPMHQTDTLFHKAKVKMGFMFGGEADNHAINTVPKETLVRIVKAEDGGLDGKGAWEGTKTGFGPIGQSEVNLKYLEGVLTTVGA